MPSWGRWQRWQSLRRWGDNQHPAGRAHLTQIRLSTNIVPAYEIEHYLTPGGKDLYQAWHDGLRDTKGRISIERRINRIAAGNFGDHKYCRDGVWELRIEVGPGYRIYYGQHGRRVVLLLCGGDKASQVWDIDRAVAYWKQAQEELI